MTPEEIAREWTNVNQVMELVKQEGDANCERAFDFLLHVHRDDVDALAASEQRAKTISDGWSADMLVKNLEIGALRDKLAASEQRVRELEQRVDLVVRTQADGDHCCPECGAGFRDALDTKMETQLQASEQQRKHAERVYLNMLDERNAIIAKLEASVADIRKAADTLHWDGIANP